MSKGGVSHEARPLSFNPPIPSQWKRSELHRKTQFTADNPRLTRIKLETGNRILDDINPPQPTPSPTL